MGDEEKVYYAFLCPNCHFLCDSMEYYETGTYKYIAYFKEENGIIDIDYNHIKTVEVSAKVSYCYNCEGELDDEPYEYKVKVLFKDGKLKIESEEYLYWYENEVPEEVYMEESVFLKMVKKLFGIKENSAIKAIDKLLKRGISLDIGFKDVKGEKAIVLFLKGNNI